MLPFIQKNLIGQILPGQKGRYEIKAEIGRGGFGQTYLAEDLDNHNQKCVVKLLKPNQDKQNLNRVDFQELKKLFEREANHLNKLNHPQIPKLKDYFVIKRKLALIVKKEFYLVEEYIEGQELSSELPPTLPLSSSQVWEILHDILEILVFLQTQKLVHRDITPENLIRRERDQKLVLVDFGTVKDMTLHQKNQPSIVVGTLPYMPIERKTGEVSFNTDVYAVGIIGIQALTGFLPNSPHANGIITEDDGQIVWRNSAPNVNSELADVIDKMVHPDWQQTRYRTAKDALDELRKIKARIQSIPVQRIPNHQPLNVPTLMIGEPQNNIQPFKPPKFALFCQKKLANFINILSTLPELYTISVAPNPTSTNHQTLAHQNTQSKPVLVIAIVAAILTVSGISSGIAFTMTYLLNGSQPENLTKTYIDNQTNMGFSINYSENWTPTTAPADEQEKVIFSPKNQSQEKTCALEVSVNIADLGKALTREEYTKIVSDTIERDKSNKLLTANQLSRVGKDYDAYEITSTRKEDRCTLKILERGTLFHKKAYYIIYQAPDKKYNKFWPVVEKMINSFEINEDS
ncbi:MULTISPECIES: serine/threonine-protein kinase [unclassified Nodularia (in: cyanobacteria)]|uniref:serine/threonine-protein kinase n=1 Tax=unclassified Nodularia (in: cyanobacteria) TaxID=2656917 RepID=UPI00187DE5EF|nr:MULTISPECIES: serine/threonine-protein kinase [unclassified Nodularia (in: cyanobacteria)]MBE9199384.1 protein kinase [Nodularia sp. LEGE 06071]MCC2695082.1 protein kinase [Nodularia sp. LEGE 04288]